MNPTTYRHTQRSPLCLLLYVVGIVILASAWSVRHEPVVSWVLAASGASVLLLAPSFHHLRVEDRRDRLAIRFGPLPIFRRSIEYGEIETAQIGRTTFLDGWGIHWSLRGGWVWNIWGRDCVVIRFRDGGRLLVGTDDVDRLHRFLQSKIDEHSPRIGR
jgi:hypothetical protein